MRKAMVKHYLITRFNIYSDQYFSGDIEKFYRWSEERVKIFEKFTRPSVTAAHAHSEFKWIVLFNQKSPQSIFDLAEKLLQKYSFIKPRFVEHGIGFAPGSIRESRLCISEDLEKTTDYVLTTRIDNDDAMHEKYMHFLLSKAKGLTEKAPIAINLEKGVCYYEGEGHIFSMKVPNMFVSILEPASNFKTVISYPHGKIGDSVPVFNIENNTPLWLMNIHDGNWANTRKQGKITKKISCFNFIES